MTKEYVAKEVSVSFDMTNKFVKKLIVKIAHATIDIPRFVYTIHLTKSANIMTSVCLDTNIMTLMKNILIISM